MGWSWLDMTQPVLPWLGFFSRNALGVFNWEGGLVRFSCWTTVTWTATEYSLGISISGLVMVWRWCHGV
jgi:hypothetical protein